MQEAKPVTAVGAPELVQLARQRISEELATLPALGNTPADFARLRLTLAAPTVSRGAVVHVIRALRERGQEHAARELFILLLERCERANQQWVHRVIRQTQVTRSEADDAREELRQELVVSLWAEIGQSRREKWELFFAHALDYAQRHTAATYMERRGLWRRAGVTGGRMQLARLLVSVSRLAADGSDSGEEWAPPDPRNPFRAAELADLRHLVSRLPENQRAVIVMRYWQGASEDEMSRALRVTSRTINNWRRAAYKSLRSWYLGDEAADGLEGTKHYVE